MWSGRNRLFASDHMLTLRISCNCHMLAFNTSTGMPYGTVNLRHGVPAGETTVTCTAGVGTFIIEFGTLSHLTGDPVFMDVALRALSALASARSSIGLVC